MPAAKFSMVPFSTVTLLTAPTRPIPVPSVAAVPLPRIVPPLRVRKTLLESMRSPLKGQTSPVGGEGDRVKRERERPDHREASESDAGTSAA